MAMEKYVLSFTNQYTGFTTMNFLFRTFCCSIYYSLRLGNKHKLFVFKLNTGSQFKFLNPGFVFKSKQFFLECSAVQYTKTMSNFLASNDPLKKMD
jgi:hypothetical protein